MTERQPSAVPMASPAVRRVRFLAAQAATLGTTTAWVLIPASTIFLERYGSGALPVTYIGAAVAGAVASAALSHATRRRPLVDVAVMVLAVLAAALLGSWWVIWQFDAEWVSIGLMVLVPILVPVGFVFVVGQAGMLLDVRELKARYGRVIAGFALGFVTGGLAGPALLAVLGSSEHLLAAAGAAAAGFLLLVVVTRRTFSAELSVVEAGAGGDGVVPRATTRSLLRNRYVVLILAFQMLSAVESQWLDFLVFDRASTRYTDSEELATFISRFTAIAYGADIIFLLVASGLLLRRFGLRYGLTANSVVVLTLVATLLVASALHGAGATIVFVLVVAARVSDLVLSDGTSRTSLGAAYQALSVSQRLTVQASIEGLAVPVAIGCSGVALLALRATVGTHGSVLPILTSVVVLAWVCVAVALARGYRVNLLVNLRHRTLDVAAITLDDPGTLAAIDRLIDSDEPRDVRLGLDTLAAAGRPDLADRLLVLTVDPRAAVRADALVRLARLDPARASIAARRDLDHGAPVVRAASLAVLAELGDAADVPRSIAALADADDDVRVAAAAATSRLADEAAQQAIVAEARALASQPDLSAARLAGRMLAACSRRPPGFDAVLRALLDHDEPAVVGAALGAIRWPDDADHLHTILSLLDHPATSGGAILALAAGGPTVLATIDDALAAGPSARRATQLVRVARAIGGTPAAMVLRRHVEHDDRDLGLLVMLALASLDAAGAHDPDAVAGVVRADLDHAAHVLRALVALDDLDEAALLRAALEDELRLLRARLLAAFAIAHGRHEVEVVRHRLAQPDPRSHALALEWLDATLGADTRVAIAVLEPDMPTRERHRRMARGRTWAPLDVRRLPHELVADVDARWRRPWIAACAVHAAVSSPDRFDDVDELVALALRRSTPGNSRVDTAVLAETAIAAGRRRDTTSPSVGGY